MAERLMHSAAIEAATAILAAMEGFFREEEMPDACAHFYQQVQAALVCFHERRQRKNRGRGPSRRKGIESVRKVRARDALLEVAWSLGKREEGMSDEEMADRFGRLESMLADLVRTRTAKEWYGTAEVASLLGRAEYTVREWCPSSADSSHFPGGSARRSPL